MSDIKDFEIKDGVLMKYTGNEVNVVIPEDVTSIGDYAFRGCTGLTSVTIPNGVTSIGDSVFEDCTDLTSVTIPNSVTSIGVYAFYNCKSLTSIAIPDSVTSIDGAFSGCTSLTSITIPNGVTSIDGAFSGCTGLTSVTIGNSVTSIGDSAFRGCTGLTSILVNSDNSIYDSRDNCNAIIETKTNKLIAGCSNTLIPNSVTSIGDSAFRGCTGLTSITIPDSVTRIGNGAFYGCTGLTSVTIPDSVTRIGNGAFYGCTGLTSITIPDSVTSIDGAFSGCTSLTSITIPDSVTSIGYLAFDRCTGLTSITIPNSVKSIGDSAFSGCTSLTSITIPDSVTSIGDYAFRGCTGLTSIKVNEGNPNYDSRHNCNAIIKTSTNSLIAGCKNTVIPDSVTSIGYWAFYGCTGLTNVTIPDSVTSIGNSAFDGCTGLTNVTIPDSVTSIGNSAFDGCTGLTSITIPDSVKIFGESISTYPLYIKNKPLSKITSFDKKLCLFGFVDNEGYKNESKEVIDSYIKYAKSQKKKLYLSILNQKNLLQFMIECKIIPLADFDLVFDIVKNNIELSALLLEYKNNNFTSQDEMKLFEKKLNTNPLSTQELKKVWGVRKNPDGTLCITSYKGSDTEVVVPESIGKSKVTTIGYLAFSPQAKRITSEILNSRKNITQITIPNSVTSIDDAAFKGCTSLTNISIPDSVTSIGDRAFADCENLTSITIPDSVTNMGDYAFYGCKDLIVHAPAGSNAEQYAKENNIPFIAE